MCAVTTSYHPTLAEDSCQILFRYVLIISAVLCEKKDISRCILPEVRPRIQYKISQVLDLVE